MAGVDKAAASIRKIAKDVELSSFSLNIPVKPEFHKYLWNHADKFRRVNNVRMVFPGGEDEQMNVVTVSGEKKEVEKARIEVEFLVKELVIISLFAVIISINLCLFLQQNTVDDKDVPVRYQQLYLARSSELLLKIYDTVGSVCMQFPGGASEVSAENVDIPPRFYGSIMKPKSQRVMQIQQDHKVWIICILEGYMKNEEFIWWID